MSARPLPRATKKSGLSSSTSSRGWAIAIVHSTASWTQAIRKARERLVAAPGSRAVEGVRGEEAGRLYNFSQPALSRAASRWAVALLALLACAAAPGVARAACTPKSNLEAIVDDSNSMQLSDPFNLRARALELLMDAQGNERRTLGAVRFGSAAASLFGPAPIGANATAFKAALAAGLHDDLGGTDYNAAFRAAASHNPAATARIFLTDGEHTAPAPYANGHAGGPPVYAIGLGVGFPGSPADALLARIARETGGAYSRASDAGELQAAMFDVNSGITCQAKPKRFTDDFTRLGRSATHSVTFPRRVRTAQFALTWSDDGDRFTVGSFRIVRKGKTVARSAKVRRLKLSRRKGTTFTAV
jgi:hypothetical protein